jgi:peptidyl-prolyl cis-trans isomerase SurA
MRLVIDLPLGYEYILVTVLDGFSKRLSSVSIKMFLKVRFSPLFLGLFFPALGYSAPESVTQKSLEAPPFEIEEILNPEPLAEVQNVKTPLKVLIEGDKSNRKTEARIAAIVNNEIISLSDLEDRLKLLTGGNLKKLPTDQLAQLRANVLRSLIDERIQLQTAKRAEIIVDDKELEGYVRNLERQSNLPPGGLRQDLKAKGIPEKTLLFLAKARAAWTRLVGTYFKDSFQISQKELGETINEEMVGSQPRYNLAEIELYVENPEAEQQVAAQANEILELLKKGKQFTQLAQERSQSPSSIRGGAIGWIREDQLEEELVTVLQNLSPGHVTPPVRTETSYKLIFIIDKKDRNTEEEVLTARQLEIPIDPKIFQDKEALPKEVERLNELVATTTNCQDFDQLADQIPNAQVHVYKNVRLFDLSADLQGVLEKKKENLPGDGILDDSGNLVYFMVCERKHMKSTAIAPTQQTADKISSQRFEATAQQKLRELRRTASIDVRV